MQLKKTLTNLVIAGALSLSISSCRDKYSAYAYKGEIKGEKIEFSTSYFPESEWCLSFTKAQNTLIVETQNKKIKYKTCDNKLNEVSIDFGYGKVLSYKNYNNESEKPVLVEAQKRYDSYLKQILETKEKAKQDKIKEGLDGLK